ncbi:MAG: aspartate carbamoyltransferase [Gammaproteobacteria bacterium]
MKCSAFPEPIQTPKGLEHPASAPEATRNLLDAIPEDQMVLAELTGKHILSGMHFNREQTLQLLRYAATFEIGAQENCQPLSGRVLSNVFLDSSRSHSRMSFNSAWLRLGGTLMNFEKTISQISGNRFAPDEVAELCNNYSDMTVLRTLESDAFIEMLDYFRVPVINAGNGGDEHPSHGLADLYTLFKWRPELMGIQGPSKEKIQIAIFGTPADTRTIRSFLFLLSPFAESVERVVIIERQNIAFAPGQKELLEAAGLQIETIEKDYSRDTQTEVIRKLLPEMDLVYMHHTKPVQVRRAALVESLKYLHPQALILNPHIHTEDFALRINNSKHNGYFAQARGAVFVRMALFNAVMGTCMKQTRGETSTESGTHENRV